MSKIHATFHTDDRDGIGQYLAICGGEADYVPRKGELVKLATRIDESFATEILGQGRRQNHYALYRVTQVQTVVGNADGGSTGTLTWEINVFLTKVKDNVGPKAQYYNE